MKERRRRRWVGALMAAAWLALVVHAGAARAAGFEQTARFAQSFGEGAFDVIVLRPLSAAALLTG